MKFKILIGCIAWCVAFGVVFSVAAGETVPPARIAHFSGDHAAAISYTFDDGLRDQYTLALPMLNEVGFKGTFFVIPGKTAETPEQGELKAREPIANNKWGGISWPEIKEIDHQGHEIASHSWSHRSMPKLPPADLDTELREANEAIKTHIGKPPLTLAFPFNASSPEVQSAALKYVLAFRSFQASTDGKSTVDSLNAWADKLVKGKKWGVMMTHGIATGYAALSDPEILRKHFVYVKSHEHDIWIDTFSNVARYEKERDDAKLTLTGNPGNVTCALSGTLDPKLYDVPLTIIIEATGATTAHAERAGQELPVRIDNGSIYLQASPSAQSITVSWK